MSDITQIIEISDITKNLENEISIIKNNININNLYNTLLVKHDKVTYDHIKNLDDETFEKYKSLLNLTYIDTNISRNNNFFVDNSKFISDTGYPVNLQQNYVNTPGNVLIEVNLSNFFNEKMNIYNYYFDFIMQFHLNITLYLNHNKKIDENIYDHEFSCGIRYLHSSNNVFIVQDNFSKLKFKLNKNNIESKNVNGELIIITEADNDNVKESFKKLLDNIDKNDLLKHIDLINTKDAWKQNPYSFVQYAKMYLMFNYLILLVLYKYISNKYSQKLNNLNQLVTYFNTAISNNIKLITYINHEVESAFNSKQQSTTTESQQIKSVIDRTSELKKINDNLTVKSQKIKNMNNKINEQQSKLNKINIVLIISIIIFIYILLCLILNTSISNNAAYISVGTILLISLIIYIYIYNLKNTAYYIAENFINSDIQAQLESNISEFKLACDTIKNKSIALSESYYDIINPLLNIELKNYREKSDNTRLYDKIASFNVNIGQRDIKFTIETIHYLVNLSILFVIVLLLLKLTDNLKYLIITISFIIFIILTTLYFVKIVRVVRTKSNNYYWDKPKPLNKKK
jgi:hypothetical protein